MFIRLGRTSSRRTDRRCGVGHSNGPRRLHARRHRAFRGSVGAYTFEPNGTYAYPANHQGCAGPAVAGHYSVQRNVVLMAMENCGPIALGAPGVDEPISLVNPRDFVAEVRYAYHRQS